MAPAPHSSSLAPTSVAQLVMPASTSGPKLPPVTLGEVTSLGQLVMSASGGSRPPPATLGPSPAPTSRERKQVSPTSVAPKPALAASGLSLAVASREQPRQVPSKPPAVASPVLSPPQEQVPVAAPASMGWTATRPRDASAPRSAPSLEGRLQPPAQASPDPRFSSSFRARPEAFHSSPEEPTLPRPPQTLPLEMGQGPPEPTSRSPGLLSPTFRPGSLLGQTVPPPLPKPPRSPSRSPSRSPNRSTCVPPAPDTALPRPSTQGAASARCLNPNLQTQEQTSAPVTTSSSTAIPSSSPSSWSAQPTCKSDPGFR